MFPRLKGRWYEKKKISLFVGVRVKGQELYKTWSKVFEAGTSANQIISCSGSRPIKFLEVRSSANQMISRPSSHLMKFLEGVEPRSMNRFSKFVIAEISSVKVYLRKGTIVYKVWPKVSEGGKSKPMSDFSRFLSSRITLWDVSSLNNVSLSTQPNFWFRIVLSEAHEAEALLLIKYFSTSFRSIFTLQ